MSRELLRRATDYALQVTSDLTGDELSLATPCAGWDAGRVVLHLADVADALVALLETGRLAMPEPARVEDPDPVCVLQACLLRLDAALSMATHIDHADAAARAGAIEFTMHGWDIGVARDRDHVIPPGLADDVREVAEAQVGDDLRGSVFAAPVEVPADAPPDDRLAGFLGRRRAVLAG